MGIVIFTIAIFLSWNSRLRPAPKIFSKALWIFKPCPVDSLSEFGRTAFLISILKPLFWKKESEIASLELEENLTAFRKASLKESGIRVESIVEKTILSPKKVEMFLGFVPEDSSFGDGKLAEDFVETGKYLKVGRRAYANHLQDFKRINAYMKCNNIRTDGTIVKWKDSRRMGRIYFRISN